jgi:phosphatidylglycerophosphate synthase
MAVAILYVPDAASGRLAVCPLAGRSLAFRAAVAAARAGASVVGIPGGLRTARLEREVRRAPEAARAVRWLDGAAPEGTFADRPCLLLPASMLAAAASLRALVERDGGPDGAMLSAAGAQGAPALTAPPPLVRALWTRLAAGHPVGADLLRHIERTSPTPVRVPIPPISVGSDADLAKAEARLYAALGTANDTGVDRLLHRRCSLPITRILLRTPATPNQVSLLSLAVGGAAVWAMWHATPASAALGVVLYAVSSIFDHSDGELARLTLQESRLGAHLDWTVDTLIHSGLALAMAVTAGHAPLGMALGAMGAAGVAMSAVLARILPREIEVGPSVGGALKNMGNRDLFYLVLLTFVLLSWLAPPLLAGLAALVALGSQCYWVACLTQIRGARAAALGRRPD